MSEEEIEKYIQAKNNILRGNDIESASYILDKHLDYNIISTGDRINILKLAGKQILNYIDETKTKGILDVVRENVKLKEENKRLKYCLKKATKIIDEYTNETENSIKKIQEYQEKYLDNKGSEIE